jgi:hypothetical protein
LFKIEALNVTSPLDRLAGMDKTNG